MEEENKAVVGTSTDTTEQTVENNVQTAVVAPAPVVAKVEATIPEAKVGEKERVFNQAQLDEIVISRLGKERARLLKKLGVEDEGQVEEIVQKAKSYQEAVTKLEQFEAEKLNVLKVDVLAELKADKDFTEFLLSKIEFGKDIETFKANANKYLEANPRFRTETYKKVNSQVSLNNGAGSPSIENMTTEQYLAYRAKNKL